MMMQVVMLGLPRLHCRFVLALRICLRFDHKTKKVMKTTAIEISEANEPTTNIVQLPAAQEAPASLHLYSDGGIEFVSDGKFTCEEKKGRYSIRPFRNPSGELVPRLSGYRPKDGPMNPGGRVRENNFASLKDAAAQRDALILEDNNTEKRYELRLTCLTQEQVLDAQTASVRMTKLPPPDWQSGNWSFEKLVSYVETNYKPCVHPKLLSEAVREFLEDEKNANLRYSTREAKQNTLCRLVKGCPEGTMTHQVPLEIYEAIIYSGAKKSTWRRVKSDLKTFADWAVDRGYCPSNLATSIKLRKKQDDYVVPRILPNEVIAKLLTEAQNFKGGCLFLFCLLGIVMALRTSEMARIQALRKMLGIESILFGEEPDENHIDVVGKTRQMRPVEIVSEYLPVLKPYVEAGFPVIPRNFAHNWTLLRAKIGYLGRRDLLPAYMSVDKLEEWTKDLLRHIGITYLLLRTGDEKTTAIWAGNSPIMIFFHYRGKSTKKRMREFYDISKQLKIRSVEELKAAGIPEGATDAELRRLKCPVEEPNTYFLSEKEFVKARAAYLRRCPEAAIPEIKGPRHGRGMWTKRKMLPLPKERADRIRLMWTETQNQIAKRYKVARSTLALAMREWDLPDELYPPKGYWQQRAAGKAVIVPDEVAALFPEGLPEMTMPVGRQIKLEWPELDKFFALLWQKCADHIATELGCSKSSVERYIRVVRLPRPSAKFWTVGASERRLPAKIQELLKLDAEALAIAVKEGGYEGKAYSE